MPKVFELITSRNIYLFIIILRFFSPFLIFFQPLPAIFLVLLLDSLDAEAASRGVLSHARYEKIDKICDSWWYFISLFYVYFYLQKYFVFLLFLFLYRLLGEVIFFMTKQRKFFFVFPNFYENAFILFFLISIFPSLVFLSVGSNLFFSLTFVFVFKMFQEYFVHINDIFKWQNLLGRKRVWLEE